MLFPVTDPEKIPAQRYYAEEFFNAEKDHLWSRVWQMACRLEQIPEIGDWVEYSNLDRSVIVVRTNEGIKAFNNHCRHRGVRLTGGKAGTHGNCAQSGFTCPFHGWRWDMNGRNTFVYGKHLFNESLTAPEDIALKPVRCETWIGCVFINHDLDAPALADCLGPLSRNLESRGLAEMRMEWWYATVLPANWKIAAEAFMESYHVMKTHPELQRAWPTLWNGMFGQDTGGIGAPTPLHSNARKNIEMMVRNLEALGGGMASMYHRKELDVARRLLDIDLPEDPQEAMAYWLETFRSELTRTLRENGEPGIPDFNTAITDHPINRLEYIFPHFFLLSPYASSAAYRVRPLAPEKCLFEIWSLTRYPRGEEPAPIMEPTVLPYDSEDFPLIPRQDYANIPLQQRGLHSDGFEYMRLSRQVEGLISNYQRTIDGYLAGRPDSQIVAAIKKLTGTFDDRIVDLGFPANGVCATFS
ncbi:MAG: aromatic ring-hydroxylating dioxygenase subunit alpha [Novosphingobium sp.]|nr:aromatic ring-hydroxylating dioxygenase subunit alpha [Novosphingobium sp.]